MKPLLFLLFILFIHYTTAQGIPVGQVVDTVVCQHMPEQSYAAYVPSYYSPDKKWPVIYIFEPAARGVLPVHIFKDSAEKWGYIIISSNHSKNGNWKWVFDAADAMFADTHKRLSINPDRIYTSGFSGGARAAIAVAALTQQVRGIIGCGAGSPNLEKHQLYAGLKTSYVGIVGSADMNFLEMKDQEARFTTKGIKNIRLTWPGIHEWPPEEMISLAVQWLDYHTNDTLSDHRKKYIKNHFIHYRDSLYGIDQREGVRISSALEREMGVSPPSQLVAYHTSKSYKKVSKSIEKAEKRERSFQSIYFSEFEKISKTRLAPIDSIHPIRWWKNEVDRWQKKGNSKDDNVSKMSLRLLNQIWATCAEKSFAYEVAKDYELALRLNEIWCYAQPNSVWALWSRAKLYVLNGDHDHALTYLEKAYESGMSSRRSITREKAFHLLKNEGRYKILFEKLSQ